jgi:polar amino acid transport system permease protein
MSLDLSAVLKGDYSSALLKGLEVTLELTLVSWMLAFSLGTLLALVRMSTSKAARGAVTAYVEFHRNVPLLVLILLWYFGVLTLLPRPIETWLNEHGSEFGAAAIAIGLCMAAYVAEDIRSGIRSLPIGQNEAARVLGLSYVQAALYVIFPQAVRIAIPLLVNRAIIFFKGTALAMTIGVAELTYVTREIENATFRTFEAYLIATVIYVLLSLIIMGVGAGLENRYRIKGK